MSHAQLNAVTISLQWRAPILQDSSTLYPGTCWSTTSPEQPTHPVHYDKYGGLTRDPCSISLTNYPQEQELCVLASLQHTNTFITLSYTFYFFDDALLGFGLLFTLSTLGFFIYFVFMFSMCFYLTSKGSCRRCRRFYFWECLDECPCCDCLVASCNPFDNCCRQSCTSCHKCCNSEACCVCIGSLI